MIYILKCDVLGIQKSDLNAPKAQTLLRTEIVVRTCHQKIGARAKG